MKFSRFAKVAGAFGVVAACMLGMVACSGANNGQAGGKVAATVNGTAIYEQDVTDQIQALRESSNLGDDDQWGLFLAMQDLTPAEIREQVIDGLVSQELVKQGAASELGITVDESEVDGYVDSTKASYDSDEAWNDALSRAGFTEESYRQSIEDSLLMQEVSEYFENEGTVSDEGLLTAAQTYLHIYDGAKRSSHILIMVDDDTDQAAAEAKANDILAQIKSGSIDFADAAREYSEDPGSAENGGDVGWDMTNSFVSEYTDALADLELDEISEPFTTDYGVHIVKVTDVFTAPEEITSLDQVPEGFTDTLTEMAEMISANDAYTEWVEGLKEAAEITVNDMPSGLPYDVDVSKYQSEVTDDAATAEDDAATAEDEAVDGAEDTASDEGEGAAEGADESAESESSSASESSN